MILAYLCLNVFFYLLNLQKCATKSDTSGHCLSGPDLPAPLDACSVLLTVLVQTQTDCLAVLGHFARVLHDLSKEWPTLSNTVHWFNSQCAGSQSSCWNKQASKTKQGSRASIMHIWLNSAPLFLVSFAEMSILILITVQRNTGKLQFLHHPSGDYQMRYSTVLNCILYLHLLPFYYFSCKILRTPESDKSLNI